ncbi:MAG: FAD-dependent monooxygenase [Nitrospiraceae bacterium]
MPHSLNRSGVLDFLIIGAGPTGLAMACELRRYGLSCRIIDQADAPSGIPKAVAVQSRTLEVFDVMGLDEEFVANGHQVHGINLYSNGQRFAHVALDGMPTRYSYMLALPQSETERLLAKRLSALGVKVERPVQFAGVAQQEDGISATLRHGDATMETVQARWLIGCDGAHSTVRKAVGLPFEGSRYEETFLLAYARIENDAPVDEAHAFFTPDGPVALLPLPQGRRYLILPLLKETAETDQMTVSPDELKALLVQRGMASLRILETFWISKFRIHRRIVPSLRVGRVFLCGDAAHIHSPAGGQGMNLGIQDSFNLAWKLALVTSGVARPSLLDSYHAERHPIASETLIGTDLATKVITLRNPLAQTFRNQVAMFLSSLDVVQHRLSQSVAGIVRNYRKSPIVGEYHQGFLGVVSGDPTAEEPPGFSEWREFVAAPAAGDRAPDGTVSVRGSNAPVRLFELLRPGRHVLLLFDGRAATAAGYRKLEEIGHHVRDRYGDLIEVHLVVPHAAPPPALRWEGSLLLDAAGELHHQYGAGSECLYLIRPDGYVGYRSQPAEADRLFAYLKTIFIS